MIATVLAILMAFGAMFMAECDFGSDRSLDGFMVTSTTVGGALADSVSDDEASCLMDGLGDYEAFRAATLVESGRDDATVRALYDCLTEANFLIYGVGVTHVWSGGWTEETQACSLDLAREHPEFIYIRVGLEDAAAHAADVYLLDFYDCLNADEKVTFMLRTFSGAPPGMADLLASIPAAESSCILDAVGVSPEQLPQRLQTDGGLRTEILRAASACISRETSVAIFVGDTVRALGGLSDASQSCLMAFGLEHFHFLELITAGEAAARALPATTVAEITDDGLRMVECLTDEELVALQLFMARVLRQPLPE